MRIRDGVARLLEHTATAVEDAESDYPRIVGTTGEGRPFEIIADIVVGADGSGSIARIPVVGAHGEHFREYPFAWFGVLLEAPPSSDQLIYLRSEDGFVLISTRDKNVQRMYFQCDPSRDTSAVSDDEIWRKLQAGVSETELVRGPIFRKDVLRFRSFVAQDLRKGRVFLMGDAAHSVPPTGAKGMNLAFSDVLWLSQALRSFFATGPEDLMRAYPENALLRIWNAQHFSYWMTSVLHITPDATEFHKQRGPASCRCSRTLVTYSSYSPEVMSDGTRESTTKTNRSMVGGRRSSQDKKPCNRGIFLVSPEGFELWLSDIG